MRCFEVWGLGFDLSLSFDLGSSVFVFFFGLYFFRFGRMLGVAGEFYGEYELVVF